MLTSKEKSDTKRLPMMPIRDVVIFPYMMTPFVVGRESSVRALEEAMAGDKKIFLATQHDASIDEPKPNEIYSVGTIVNIVQSLKLPDGNIKVLVEGVERARVVSVADDEGFFRATVRTSSFKVEIGPQLDALVSRVTGEIEATSRSADIMLMLPGPGPYSIDAKSKFGSVASDFSGANHRTKLMGEQFAGANPPPARRIYLRIGFGGITIKEVPPTPEAPVAAEVPEQ